MPQTEIKYNYNCSDCKQHCDGKSKMVYNFEHDTQFSEKFEHEIIERINKTNNFAAQKTQKNGYPDIEITAKNELNKIIRYFEIKVQARTFMSVSRLLPMSKLIPSETIALNLSDLKRYFEIKKHEKCPLFLIWIVFNRPCVVKKGKYRFFYQEIDILQKIYSENKTTRVFRRKSGKGDIVNGEHKGVVVNYHFSLNELIAGLPKLDN